MAIEFVVAGRRELPKRSQPWQVSIEDDRGGVLVYEAAISHDDAGCESLTSQVAEVVGWMPRSIVFLRRAWDLAQVVAEELARALEGVVYCDVDNAVFFDAAKSGSPVASLQELEARLREAFNNPEPFFDRWRKDEKARFETEQKIPSVAAETDWSDV